MYTHRLAVTQCFVIERKRTISDLKTIVGWRRRATDILTHGREIRLPLMHCQKDFAVIPVRIILRLHINKTKLSAVKAAMKMFSCECVTLVPAAARRPGRETVSAKNHTCDHLFVT